MNNLRVAITGAGPVSALGLGFDEFAKSLSENRNGIGELTLFDSTPYGISHAVEVPAFDINQYVSSRQAYLDRAAELTFAAMRLAINDAGLDMATLDRSMTGLSLGSAWGCMDTTALFFADVLEKGPRHAKPFLFPHTYSNTVISMLAMEYELKGYHINFASGAVASAQALVQAYDLVRTGRQQMVFAGGFEALSETRLATASLLGKLAKDVCAPFDKSAGGTILGEGSGILVLEEWEHAIKRGARIRGELTGAGMAQNIDNAMRQAYGTDKNTACVLASANGCPAPDQSELAGISSFFNQSSDRIPITAPKSLLGETGGAAGALHAIVALSILADGHIPVTANLTCPVNSALDFVTSRGRKSEVSRVLINSMNAGGNAVCLAIERFS